VHSLVKTKRCMLAMPFIAATLTGQLAHAQEAQLEGSWRGSGKVTLPSGEAERATCRARFTRRSAEIFEVSALCSTSSVRLSQTASLRRTSEGGFAGQFFNAEYNISGAIRVRVRGNSIQASLNGGGGSASFSMTR
jgi:hypothetical protein